MLVIPLIGAAVAVALGTRFRISVLLPATVLALVTTIIRHRRKVGLRRGGDDVFDQSSYH
jgi:hypothetical protein